MGKLLILLIVVAAALWWLGSRRGPRSPPAGTDKPTTPPARTTTEAQAMMACAHCGVHLPQQDTVADAAGRPFCSEAHRLAGPRPPA